MTTTQRVMEAAEGLRLDVMGFRDNTQHNHVGEQTGAEENIKVQEDSIAKVCGTRARTKATGLWIRAGCEAGLGRNRQGRASAHLTSDLPHLCQRRCRIHKHLP